MIADVVPRRGRDDADLSFERRFRVERIAAQIDQLVRVHAASLGHRSGLGFPMMPRRVVNLALLVVVPSLVATGLLAWIASRPIADALVVLHRIAGVALVLALAWKYGIARRAVRRRPRAGVDPTLAVGPPPPPALPAAAGPGPAWPLRP